MALRPVRFLKRKESVAVPSYFHEVVAPFQLLHDILCVPPHQRTKAQITSLANFSIHLKFFQDLSAELSAEAHEQCCKHLKYHQASAGRFLFRQGDPGSQFFIILQGSCAVLTRDGKDLRQLTVLRQGECFGELALLSHKPRAASVLCREECHFAILERDDYTRILGRIQDSKLQEKVDILFLHPVFQKWTRSAIQRLSYYFKVLTYKRKQQLFQAGQEVSHIFFLKSGEFHLFKDVLIQEEQRSTRCSVDVTVVCAGEILGAEETLSSQAHQFSCRCASTQGEAMIIAREDFRHVLANEETLDYLRRMAQVKQTYRYRRVLTAIQVEREKRAVQSVNSSPHNSALEQSLKSRLQSPEVQGAGRRTRSLTDVLLRKLRAKTRQPFRYYISLDPCSPSPHRAASARL